MKAYVPLANTTLTTNVPVVSFNGISALYRDLVIVANGNITSGFAPDIYVQYNGDTSNTNYVSHWMVGSGTNANSSVATNSSAASRIGLWQDRSSLVMTIFDYSQTDKHKHSIARTNSAGSSWGTSVTVHRWFNTAAINTVVITASSAPADFQAGTTFALYGILA